MLKKMSSFLMSDLNSSYFWYDLQSRSLILFADLPAHVALFSGYVTQEAMPTNCWAKRKTAHHNWGEPLLVAKWNWNLPIKSMHSIVPSNHNGIK